MQEEDKAGMRAWARGLPPASPAQSQAVVRHLAGWIAEQRPACVLTYLAIPGEVEVSELQESFPAVIWLVTRTPSSGPLTIHSAQVRRERHPHGFEQPVAGSPELDPGEIEVALVPGLAFDRRGARLGRGGAHYDRLLGRLPLAAVRVGVTLERRLVPRVPEGPRDVRMSRMATEVACWAVAVPYPFSRTEGDV
ncbi:MAG: 5-formyltetrahydrofolate cyclo-ligase [Acidimicrobiia bacterium]